MEVEVDEADWLTVMSAVVVEVGVWSCDVVWVRVLTCRFLIRRAIPLPLIITSTITMDPPPSPRILHHHDGSTASPRRHRRMRIIPCPAILARQHMFKIDDLDPNQELNVGGVLPEHFSSKIFTLNFYQLITTHRLFPMLYVVIVIVTMTPSSI